LECGNQYTQIGTTICRNQNR